MKDVSLLPKISVVTPSYNQGQFLEATIKSVLDQDYPNLEYIIIDGGSTDNSLEIIRKYEHRLSYWASEPDGGQADGINKGFGHASGELLGWLNSDDIYAPGAIKYVANQFMQNPEWQFLYGDGRFIDETGKYLGPCTCTRKSFGSNYILNHDPIVQPASFWRRQLWRHVGPLDTGLNWAFDWDWFIRAYTITPFHYCPQSLANYRLHAKAKTQSGSTKREAELITIMRRHKGQWQHAYLMYRAHQIEHTIETILGPLATPIRPLVKLILPVRGFILAILAPIFGLIVKIKK